METVFKGKGWILKVSNLGSCFQYSGGEYKTNISDLPKNKSYSDLRIDMAKRLNYDQAEIINHLNEWFETN